ncbi:MAG: DNA topoisomerase IB [Polyangia bacterium]
MRDSLWRGGRANEAVRPENAGTGVAKSMGMGQIAARAAAHTEDDEEAVKAAALAGLHYVHDTRPGISRKRNRNGFDFFDPHGRRIRDPQVLQRIRSLAVPPAYEQVWICSDPRGHLQATGRDARGRKQYRYHARWREVRDANKYERMVAFGQALPKLRAHVDEALQQRGLTRDLVLATLVRLLDATLIRVGNEEYARTNHSYGLTTLLAKHVEIHGGTVRFAFKGKSGVEHEVSFADRRVARALHACMELPGQELFHYVGTDGSRHAISSHDVNDYLRAITGADFTAKDYRTWAGSVLALDALRPQTFKSAAEAKRLLAATVKTVAARLRNTPAVCRKCYIHPTVIDTYIGGGLHAVVHAPPRRHLTAEESTLLRFLGKQKTR